MTTDMSNFGGGHQILVNDKFDELEDLHEEIKTALRALNFTQMTEIQRECIPQALAGRDILGAAKTGSGKTLAFLVPLLNRVITMMTVKTPRFDPNLHGTAAIILSPTRELSLQTFSVLKQLLEHVSLKKLRVGLIMGGTNKLEEAKRLAMGVTILVATPGRLLDHLSTTANNTHNTSGGSAGGGNFKTAHLSVLVIDEADRLMEQGFEEHMSRIMRLLPGNATRQTMLFSATLNIAQITASNNNNNNKKSKKNKESPASKIACKVHNLANISLRANSCFSVDVTTRCSSSSAAAATSTNTASSSISASTFSSTNAAAPQRQPNPTVAGCVQQFLVAQPHTRFLTLYTLLLRRSAKCKTMVFMNSALEVAFYHELLSFVEVPHVSCIHGRQKQPQRVGVYNAFVAAPRGTLLCTDVAARGLDIPAVQWVVQFDPPDTVHDYVHRVGRTARGERGQGSALLFLRPHELDFLLQLERFGVPIEEVALDQKKLNAAGAAGGGAGEGEGFSQIQESMNALVRSHRSLTSKAVEAFRAVVRSYAAMGGGRHCSAFRVSDLDLSALAANFGLTEVPWIELSKLNAGDQTVEATATRRATKQATNNQMKGSFRKRKLGDCANQSSRNGDEQEMPGKARKRTKKLFLSS